MEKEMETGACVEGFMGTTRCRSLSAYQHHVEVHVGNPLVKLHDESRTVRMVIVHTLHNLIPSNIKNPDGHVSCPLSTLFSIAVSSCFHEILQHSSMCSLDSFIISFCGPRPYRIPCLIRGWWSPEPAKQGPCDYCMAFLDCLSRGLNLPSPTINIVPLK